jgi:glycosyltransferase involved in cell wall biosynthesis
VLFLSRVEDTAKGCFLLPKIISQVRSSGVDVQWQIAGDGPDLAELRRRCNGSANVQFLGRIAYEHVPQVLAQADIYIFPSRYEGFGLSLVEAMAAGCVPVASAIRGVTDSIVDHDKTGCLFPIGDWQQAGEYVARLAREPARVRELSVAARESVSGRFSVATVAEQYVSLMNQVRANPRPLKAPLDVQRWRYPRGLRPGLRNYLPPCMKTRLRGLRESISGRTT